ncbi:hypothetical protein HOB94_00875 [bacterium]|nr:hypothetical protein [bacterium]MBT4632572.1 hypothetical protein [bacterium]MBT6779190.1 hypothetical protein [bacterium]
MIHIFFHQIIFDLVTVTGVASIFISIFLSKSYLSFKLLIICSNCLILSTLGVHHHK